MKFIRALAAAATVMATLLSPVEVAVATTEKCTLIGTNNSETLQGTNGNDVICGAGGSDVIYGLGGNDVIFGGTGNDRIYSGTGNDKVYGESGKDLIYGSSGADLLDGGSGTDTLSGRDGQDFLIGGAANDSISGGSADDRIDGGTGADSISTGAGLDVCGLDSADKMLDACQIDSKGPEFGPVTMEVRTFEAGNEATFEFDVRDQSGVAFIQGYIGGPPGWVTSWCGFGIQAERKSGTETTGSYRIRCPIPKDAVNETYSLFVKAGDRFGFTSDGPTIAFQVINGSDDNRVPELVEVDTPDSTSAASTLVIRTITTDESGVAGVYVWLMLKGGGFSDGTAIYAQGSDPLLISKDDGKFVFEQKYSFSSTAPLGQYEIWVSVRDSVGNRDFFASGKSVDLVP